MAAMSSPDSIAADCTAEKGVEMSAEEILRRHGKTLLRLAADSIDHGLRENRALAVAVADYATDLGAPGASFVTLKNGDSLRGCIGSALAHQALVLDVAANAFAAAFHDSRFPALETHERGDLSISVSVLSAPENMNFASEAELLSLLRPGIDGLIINDGVHSALFLPAVWDSLSDPRIFLEHLKHKAGLSADHWSDSFTARHFTAAAVTLFTDGAIAHGED
ncbi:MAG: AmmeMemoRadiSam system protein A [Alphaproteobacteria bacterium]|nr:AmmeMemoRadiSam system protein A [Alphaproteobacteria bacterium]MEE1562124.1 AmmeMemoRadiSam system protein A [Alphaproteobacteria bacterium]